MRARTTPESFARWGGVLALAVVLCGLIPGCTSEPVCGGRCCVSADLESRGEQSLGPEQCAGETMLPPGVDLDDGVTEDEAIAVALWNNAAFRETMAQLGVSRATLFDAGLLTDPQMTMFFPLGPKQLEFTIYFALDAIWLRPIRMRAASLDLGSVSEQMVQNGLNLVRDVRVAYANLQFAQKRSALANEAQKIRKEISDLAQKRLKAGDISELEYNSVHVTSLQADADAVRFAQDVIIARNNLRTLLGLTLEDVTLTAVDGPTCRFTDRPQSELVNEALAFRPDLRAAEINAQAAYERTDVARGQFMPFEIVADANSRGIKGFEMGPGMRLRIPILNANRGGIAIAEAQHRQALKRYVTVRDQITLDVRTAYVQAIQARDNLNALQQRILPKLKSTVDLATKSYRRGGTSYFLVLESTGQFLDSHARELEMEAAFRRAVAELDRSVGHRISCKVETPAPPVPAPPIPAINDPADTNPGTSQVVTASANQSETTPPTQSHGKPPSRPKHVFPRRPEPVAEESREESRGFRRFGLPAVDWGRWLRKGGKESRGEIETGESREAPQRK